MKKLFLFAMAATALTFASCDKTAQKPADAQVDSATVDSTQVTADESTSAISELTSKLDAKDAGAFKTALNTVNDKIKELATKNPDAAKQLLTKVQGFLKDNADKIKANLGNNAAVETLVNTLTTAPVDKFVDGLKAAGETKDKALDAASKAESAIKDAPEAAKAAADKKVEEAKAKANEKANEAVNEAKQKTGEAVDKAASDIKNKLGI
ncbi:MAG: hypothetical protein SPK85_04750 [Prevotella sp.]|jgi:vacuolar-type H+-ATPase subunit H|nr:hypothetical protein [Prevotella sp.]MBQ3895815.1 hypothetical protein [Paludibacteraceae bacterium]MBP3744081.1 hypothetical protein [Prevotella sp.]MBQ1853992.1 hypothetical protein [Prevotella sp.]MBQ6422373.1 hypothetical protein [Prevotella sp.]